MGYLALICGYPKVVIESDCTVVINMTKAQQPEEMMSTLIRQIILASSAVEQVSFVFTKREANMMADGLAKSCDCFTKDLHIIEIPNAFIANLLFQNISHMNSI